MLADPVAAARLATKAGRFALRTGKVPPRLAWRRWMLSRGVDDTAAATSRATLVVAPHPDDETIGCGAAIARKRAAGTPVDVVVVTDGRHSHASPLVSPSRLAELREGESRAACDLLGVASGSVRFLGYEEGTLWRCLDQLTASLAALIETVRPDEILVTSEHDWHDDHRAVNAAVCRAAAATGFGGRLGAFPVWFWADGPWTTKPTAGLGETLRTLGPPPGTLRLPRPWLVASEGFVDRKRAAFACYLSQTTNLTGEPTWAVFPDGWLDPFCGPHEPFFPVAADPHAGASRVATSPPAAAAGRVVPASTVAAVADDFDDERPLGAVIGSRSGTGAVRQGVDAEAAVGIDGGELRFAALARPGWGRQGVSYGPFDATPGLTVAVQVLNGHNNAQSNTLPQGRKALARRLAREFPHVELDPPHIDDNLAIGFFPAAAPTDAAHSGHALMMHAGGITNGELRARVDDGLASLVSAVQELPLRYVVALRETGAVYYLASVPGAHGAAALPSMRPVAVDATPPTGPLWAGIHQAVHGEVGHDIATRVAALRAEVVAELAGWGAGTLAADRLDSAGAAADWQPGEGSLVRTTEGMAGAGGPAWAWLALPAPAGLVHAVIDTAAVQGSATVAGLVFRIGADGSAWRVLVTRDRASLEVRDGANPWTEVAESAVRLESGRRTSLQVLDDGASLAVNLGGTALFGWISDTRHADNPGVGVLAGAHSSATVRDFEAFGRSVPVPVALDLGEPWFEQGREVAFVETFAGPGGPLESAGWQRTMGDGRFELAEGGGCVVVASPERPNPGRTLYTRAWPHPDLADLEVELTPPGTAQGQGHGSRGGVTFFQDADNLLVLNVWLDDTKDHDGSSLSLFFRLDGRERMYDAVWTNVGRRVRWGKTSVVRACFDGSHLVAWLDGEPVLWRRISDIRPGIAPLRINRVGLVANREWGDDTGTVFHSFTARRR